MLVRAEVCNENLVCLFKRSVETVFASKDPVCGPYVYPVGISVARFEIKNLYKDVFLFVVSWHGKQTLLTRLDLPLQRLQYTFSKLKLVTYRIGVVLIHLLIRASVLPSVLGSWRRGHNGVYP